jgi:hypothetical protein
VSHSTESPRDFAEADREPQAALGTPEIVAFIGPAASVLIAIPASVRWPVMGGPQIGCKGPPRFAAPRG